MQLPCPGKPSGLVGLFLLSVLSLPALVRADVITDLNDKARMAFNSSGQNFVFGMMQLADLESRGRLKVPPEDEYAA